MEELGLKMTDVVQYHLYIVSCYVYCRLESTNLFLTTSINKFVINVYKFDIENKNHISRLYLTHEQQIQIVFRMTFKQTKD